MGNVEGYAPVPMARGPETDGEVAERDMRRIVQSGEMLLWVGSRAGVRRWVGSALAKFTGLPAEALAGDGWTEALHPEDVERCKAIGLHCLPLDHRFTLDYRLRARDGRYLWMLDSATPCHAPSGEFEGHVGVLVDIDERRLIEDQLAERLQTLRAASRD